MKRTRKWAFVAQEATRLHALGLKPSEIAEKLGVNKSTVTRWIADGRLPQREEAPAPSAEEPSEEPGGEKRSVLLEWKGKTAAQWAAAVRREYDLSVTDEQLVDLAERALALSRDPLAKNNIVLMAMGRFQALTRQLALKPRHEPAQPEAPAPATAEEKPARPTTQRADPRSSLFEVH